MLIEVRIPYDEKGRLAAAYNNALAEGTSEWVLFLDHDVFLCNPLWYEMCVAAINYLAVEDPKAACIGCVCGGERHKRTMEMFGPPKADIEQYILESQRRYKKHEHTLYLSRHPAPGFFLLLKREIAKEIGFVQKKRSINNIDTDFGERLMEAGYHIYQMPGLYIYHRRGMKHLKKEFTIQ